MLFSSNSKIVAIELYFIVRALVYCNFHREVRLVSARHVSACATMLRLRALLYLRASH